MKTSYIIDLETILIRDVYETWLSSHEENSKRFPPPFCWEIICFSYAKLSYGKLERLGVTCLPGTEKKGLEHFNSAVLSSYPQIITWNGRRFDLPIISYRNLVHQNTMEWYHDPKAGYKYRYSTEKHFDLLDYLSEYGQHSISLNQAAKLLRLPGKTDVKGSDVADLYANGKIQDIIKYNINDILQTYMVYLKVELLRGNFSREEYDSIIQEAKLKVKAEGDLDLDETGENTVLGNSIYKEETLAIAATCRTLAKDFK